MSLIRKHGAVLQAWACLDLVLVINACCFHIHCSSAWQHWQRQHRSPTNGAVRNENPNAFANLK